MAIGEGLGSSSKLLEKDRLEKVSVGSQGAECSFCRWGAAPGGGTGAGRAGRRGGFFPGESPEVAWEEGGRGC